jgi:hypothetical protein
MHMHHWDLETLENMFPWEYDIYVILLMKRIEEENDRLKKQANLQKTQATANKQRGRRK